MDKNVSSVLKTLEDYVTLAEELEQQEEMAQIIAQRNQEVIDNLLQGNAPIKLELGAGADRNLPGWTTADLNEECDLILNLIHPLPFPDNSVSEIYSSHVLEHFAYPEPMVSLLAECYRVLQPQGVFRVCVPNARLYIEGYLNPNQFDAATFCRYTPAFHYHSPIDFINYIAYMDGHHCYMFDEGNLQAILVNAGFQQVGLREFDPEIDMEARRLNSIFAVGKK